MRERARRALLAMGAAILYCSAFFTSTAISCGSEHGFSLRRTHHRPCSEGTPAARGASSHPAQEGFPAAVRQVEVPVMEARDGNHLLVNLLAVLPARLRLRLRALRRRLSPRLLRQPPLLVALLQPPPAVALHRPEAALLLLLPLPLLLPQCRLRRVLRRLVAPPAIRRGNQHTHALMCDSTTLAQADITSERIHNDVKQSQSRGIGHCPPLPHHSARASSLSTRSRRLAAAAATRSSADAFADSETSWSTLCERIRGEKDLPHAVF